MALPLPKRALPKRPWFMSGIRPERLLKSLLFDPVASLHWGMGHVPPKKKKRKKRGKVEKKKREKRKRRKFLDI
jgi:hypothetical protein